MLWSAPTTRLLPVGAAVVVIAASDRFQLVVGGVGLSRLFAVYTLAQRTLSARRGREITRWGELGDGCLGFTGGKRQA